MLVTKSSISPRDKMARGLSLIHFTARVEILRPMLAVSSGFCISVEAPMRKSLALNRILYCSPSEPAFRPKSVKARLPTFIESLSITSFSDSP